MSKDVPRISGREAKRAFERAGFHEDRMAGSHCIMKKAGRRYNLSIPMHPGKTVGLGLLKSLIETAGLTVEEFKKFL